MSNKPNWIDSMNRQEQMTVKVYEWFELLEAKKNLNERVKELEAEVERLKAERLPKT